MTGLSDTISFLTLETWNATDNGLLSYVKSPIQNTFFNNNSELIGKALRQAILYFGQTLTEIDYRKCTMGTEFRSKRTRKYQLPSPDKASETTLMEITTYAPIGFDYMRTTMGISRNAFEASFSQDELVNFANTGRSGAQMYKTSDDIYIIKTIRDHEAKLLIQSLSGFYLRYSYMSSLMARYVGLYSVSIRSIFPTEIYCVVMLNNLPSAADLHEIYDLKGSSVGRHAEISSPAKRLKSLKDLDFPSFYPRGIRLPSEIYRRLRITIESDILELKKMMITDFSLILGVYHLDKHVQDKEACDENSGIQLKPQLGLSTLMQVMHPGHVVQKDEKVVPLDPGLINKFILKPLHLIACPQEDTFSHSSIASSMLGIPGLTDDGRRVLLYPAVIDILQSFDNFKRMQSAIQSLRDREHSNEYSVIHPDEYEKRFLKFLFEKVFINSNQTLEQLLTSPALSKLSPEIQDSSEQYESFEMIQTTCVLQDLAIRPLTSTSIDKAFVETTPL